MTSIRALKTNLVELLVVQTKKGILMCICSVVNRYTICNVKRTLVINNTLVTAKTRNVIIRYSK